MTFRTVNDLDQYGQIVGQNLSTSMHVFCCRTGYPHIFSITKTLRAQRRGHAANL